MLIVNIIIGQKMEIFNSDCNYPEIYKIDTCGLKTTFSVMTI